MFESIYFKIIHQCCWSRDFMMSTSQFKCLTRIDSLSISSLTRNDLQAYSEKWTISLDRLSTNPVKFDSRVLN